jgi:hypothetical protein
MWDGEKSFQKLVAIEGTQHQSTNEGWPKRHNVVIDVFGDKIKLQKGENFFLSLRLYVFVCCEIFGYTPR